MSFVHWTTSNSRSNISRPCHVAGQPVLRWIHGQRVKTYICFPLEGLGWSLSICCASRLSFFKERRAYRFLVDCCLDLSLKTWLLLSSAILYRCIIYTTASS